MPSRAEGQSPSATVEKSNSSGRAGCNPPAPPPWDPSTATLGQGRGCGDESRLPARGLRAQLPGKRGQPPQPPPPTSFQEDPAAPGVTSCPATTSRWHLGRGWQRPAPRHPQRKSAQRSLRCRRMRDAGSTEQSMNERSGFLPPPPPLRPPRCWRFLLRSPGFLNHRPWRNLQRAGRRGAASPPARQEPGRVVQGQEQHCPPPKKGARHILSPPPAPGTSLAPSTSLGCCTALPNTTTPRCWHPHGAPPPKKQLQVGGGRSQPHCMTPHPRSPCPHRVKNSRRKSRSPRAAKGTAGHQKIPLGGVSP